MGWGELSTSQKLTADAEERRAGREFVDAFARLKADPCPDNEVAQQRAFDRYQEALNHARP